MEFKFSLLALLCSGAILTLPGCGSGGGSSAPTASSVSGVAMAGRFLSGQICAYQLDNGIQGEQIGCSGFDTSSQYAINVGSYSGDVLLAVETGATYDDEATTGDETNGTPLMGTLRTIVRVNGGSVSAPVTPLTEILVRLLDVLSSDALATQASTISSLLPLGSDVNILTTLPALGDSNAAQMAYLEILRALSELQAGKGLSGDLGSYLEILVSALELNDPETMDDFKSSILTQLQAGLSEYCSVSNNILSCTPPSGGSQTLSCNTGHYSSPVQVPTTAELTSFAGTYTGKEGTYSEDFSTFNPSGDVQLLLGADGSATYNGTQYPLYSICVEDNETYGKTMYLELGQGHIDLFITPFSDGTGLVNWTGSPPTDANKTIKGDYVTNGGNNGGGSGTGVTLSAPVEGYSSISNSVVTMSDQTSNSYTLINKKGTWGDVTNAIGLAVGYTKMQNPAPGSYYGNSAEIESITVIVAKGIPVVSAPLDTQGYLCTLTADYPIAKCADKGISFDRATGLVSFSSTPMKTVVGSSGSFTINGSLNFTPF